MQEKANEISIYKKTAEQLLARYCETKNLQAKEWPTTDDNWEKLAKWLLNTVRPNIKGSTWKKYRRSICAVTGNQLLEKTLYKKEHFTKIQHIQTPQQVKKTNRDKRAANEEVALLCQWLRVHSLKWGVFTSNWLLSNKMIGLRPNEWKESYLDLKSGGPYIKVKTAKKGSGNKTYQEKQTNDYRYIPLRHLPAHDIKIIETHLFTVQNVKKIDQWAKFYDGCRFALMQANKAVLPQKTKTITLNSGRHAFSSNFKDRALPDSLAGELLGQYSGNTFRRVYGRKSTKKYPHYTPEFIETLTKKLKSKKEESA